MKYFKKINLQNVVAQASGSAITFTPTVDGYGVIALDESKDAAVISALDDYADRRVGGVVRISREIYDAQLKKKASPKSRRQLNGLRIAAQPNPPPKNPSRAAPAVGAEIKLPLNRDDLAPNFSQFRNRTRKLMQAQPDSK